MFYLRDSSLKSVISTTCVALAGLLAVACESGTTTAPGESGSATGTDTVLTRDDTTTSMACVSAGSQCEQGALLKDVKLQNCAGEAVSLSDFVCDHKATLIYFGAGWCQPCRDKQPKLKEWYEANRAAGLHVVTILKEQNAPNDPATPLFCEEWKKTYGLDFPVLIDPADKLTSDCLGTGGLLPVTAVVDPAWKVVYKDVGGEASDAEETFKELLAL